MMRRVLVASVLLSLSAGAMAATEKSIMLMMGKPAGVQNVDYAADGTLSVHFEYNDRGRGPVLDAKYAIDHSVIAKAEIKGVSYLKSPVQEAFALDGAKAKWKNNAEDESRDNAANAFYLSLDGVPEESALLARALLAAPQ